MFDINFWKVILSCLLIFSILTGCNNKKLSSDSTGTSETAPTYRAEYDDAAKNTDDSAFVDTDGDFSYKTVDWDGPDGYVIIIPHGNKSAEKTAKILKDFFYDTYEINLDIKTDKNAEVSKEIIIGQTNRTQEQNKLSENKIEVKFDGEKLFFLAGHEVTLNSAVEKYVRIASEKDKAYTFSLETDFKSVKLDGYNYVWGDEFEGTSLDRHKWSLIESIGESEMLEISDNEDLITVDNGRMTLRAVHYFNPHREGTQYKEPRAVATKYNMNFVYGYAEIRARVPFKYGALPSFWTQGTDYLSGIKKADYMVEVDIFEVYGTRDTLVPNLHKWYDDGRHTTWPGEKNTWIFSNVDTINNEYHVYGWEWTPTEMSMYVDGEKYMTFDTTKSFDEDNDISGFSDPAFIMFNNHLFTSDQSWQPSVINNKDLPVDYIIDYFRFYQKDGQGRIWIDETGKE